MRIIKNIADRKGLEKNEQLAYEAAVKAQNEQKHGSMEPEPAASAVAEETEVQNQEKAKAKKKGSKAKAEV